MVAVEEFKELGKKYGFEIYESIFSEYVAYVKDGMYLSDYDLKNKKVSVCNKLFMNIPYQSKIVNDIEELENELQITLKKLKEYRMKQKIDKIDEDF